jgi:hypothetical protein
VNSRNSAHSILHRTPPQNRKARSLTHPNSSTDPYTARFNVSDPHRMMHMRGLDGGLSDWPKLRRPAGRSGPLQLAVRTPFLGEVVRRICLLGGWVHRPFEFASHGDDDFPSGVSFFQIPDGLGNLGKSVSPVDHQREGAVLNELLQELQVLPVWFHREGSQLLAHQC